MPGATRSRRWGLPELVIGLLAAGVLVRFGWPAIQTLGLPIEALAVASYAVVWVPLLGAVLFASFARGQRSLAKDFGFRFRPIDILLGIGVGLGLRFLASLLELVTGGTLVLAPTEFDWLWLTMAVIAPVLIAPWIEELFFRGLALRAIRRAFGRRPASAAVKAALAIVISAVLFAAVHLLEQPMDAWPRVAAINLVVGIVLGTLALRTGRLGGPIIAHIVFNATGLAPLLTLVTWAAT